MAFIPTPNTVQLVLQGTLHGSTLQNTLYFQKSGGGSFSEADATALITAVEAWWNTNIGPNLSDELNFTRAIVYDQTSENAPVYNQSIVCPGQLFGNALPSNCAYSVSFKTNNRGRSGRGRNYVPGIRENNMTGNVVQGSIVTGLLTGYTALITDATTAGFVWGVLSRYTNNAPRPSGFFQPITNISVANAQIDSQRKRVTQV